MEITEVAFEDIPLAAQLSLTKQTRMVPHGRLCKPGVGFAIYAPTAANTAAAATPALAFALFPLEFGKRNSVADVSAVAELRHTSPRERLGAAKKVLAAYRRRAEPGQKRVYLLVAFLSPVVDALFRRVSQTGFRGYDDSDYDSDEDIDGGALAELPGAVVIPDGIEGMGAVLFPLKHGRRLCAREKGSVHTAFIRLRFAFSHGFVVAPRKPEGDEVLRMRGRAPPGRAEDEVLLLARRRVWLREAGGKMTVHFETPLSYLTSNIGGDVFLSLSLDGDPFRFDWFRLNKLLNIHAVTLAPGAASVATQVCIDQLVMIQITGFTVDAEKAYNDRNHRAFGMPDLFAFLRAAPTRRRLEAAAAIRRAWRRAASDPRRPVGQRVLRARFEALGAIAV